MIEVSGGLGEGIPAAALQSPIPQDSGIENCPRSRPGMVGENERRDTLTQSVHTQLLQTKNAVAMNYRNTPPAHFYPRHLLPTVSF